MIDSTYTMMTGRSETTNRVDGKTKIFDTCAVVFLFLSLNWSIISIDTLGVDGAAITPFVFGAAVALFGLRLLRRANIAIGIWIVWIAYAVINSLVCGINRAVFPRLIDMLIQLLLPLWTMFISYALTVHGRKNMVTVLFWVLLTCCIEMSFRVGAFTNFSLYLRLPGARAVNPNMLGIYLAFLLAAGAMYWLRKKRLVVMMIFSTFVVLMIFRTASRTALYIAVVALVGGFFLWRNKAVGYLLAACIVLTVFACGDVFENTAMWQRMENTEYDMEKMYFADTWLAKIMGDRASYYFGGWEIFSKNTVNGVGLNNYIFHNPFGEYVCHVEIMAQLSEEGVLGTVIFMLFYVVVGWQLWKTREFKSVFEWRFCLMLFILICIVNFSSYTAMRSVYYMFFGYIVGYLERLRAQAKIANPSVRTMLNGNGM